MKVAMDGGGITLPRLADDACLELGVAGSPRLRDIGVLAVVCSACIFYRVAQIHNSEWIPQHSHQKAR